MASLISVSRKGVSVPNGTGADITFNTKYPFWKLDSLNPVSFQIITILLNVEPPNPDGAVEFYKRNLIYSFPHGYNYVPSTWFELSIPGYTPFYGPGYDETTAGPFPIGPEGVYLRGGGGLPLISSAVFIVTVDSTNVNIFIDKYYDTTMGVTPPPDVIGDFLHVRSYVAVNDLLGGDVPTHD
jgi:hypothetical protein